MAFIEVDPKQTKAVIALLVALVGAIGFIFVRMHPSVSEPGPVAAKQQAAVTEKRSAAPAREKSELDLSRNPFERPANLPLEPAHGSKMSTGSGLVTEDSQTERPDHSGQLAPARVGQLPASVEVEAPRPFRSEKSAVAVAPAGREPAKPEQSKPAFTLLATVRGAKGYSAVIRGSVSVARVVEVGDVLDGGFRVKEVDSSRAVLTDGRETIVAKRPQS